MIVSVAFLSCCDEREDDEDDDLRKRKERDCCGSCNALLSCQARRGLRSSPVVWVCDRVVECCCAVRCAVSTIVDVDGASPNIKICGYLGLDRD